MAAVFPQKGAVECPGHGHPNIILFLLLSPRTLRLQVGVWRFTTRILGIESKSAFKIQPSEFQRFSPKTYWFIFRGTKLVHVGVLQTTSQTGCQIGPGGNFWFPRTSLLNLCQNCMEMLQEQSALTKKPDPNN
jgi:hypothetical protein